MEAWRRELRHNLLMHSFLCHYAKGQTASKHKYVAIRDGRYIYHEDLVNQKNSSGMGSRDPRYQRQGNGMIGDPRYAKPQQSAMAGDPRYAKPQQSAMAGDPRYAKPQQSAMAGDPRYAKPQQSAMAGDPRYAKPQQSAMAGDPRYAKPQQSAMAGDPRYAKPKDDTISSYGGGGHRRSAEPKSDSGSENIDKKTREDIYKVGSQMKGASSEQVEKKASDIADQTGLDFNEIFNVLWAASRMAKGDVLGAKRIMDRNKSRVANSQQPYKRGGYR